jgi:pimeloyl-ACP methyl ester carboxylesterase
MQLEVITRTPETTPAHATPLLFVHGAWHGAWCWDEYFLPYFAQHRYTAVAMSARGHGKSEGRERLRWLSSGEFVADIEQVANSFSTPPVLIGHSMGGYAVQKYLETHRVPAAVLLASVPTHGIWQFSLRNFKRFPLKMLRFIVTLTPEALIRPRSTADALLFSGDLTPEVRAKYYAQLQGESFRLAIDSLFLALPRVKQIKASGTPMLVLAAQNDQIFSVAEEEATARAYGAEFQAFPNMAHDMMLESGWQAAADKIIAWLGERGL